MELILANANGILLYNLNNYTIEKMQSISNICNIDKRDLVLIGAIKRPMSKVMTSALERLAKRGIPEAIRELEIRKQK